MATKKVTPVKAPEPEPLIRIAFTHDDLARLVKRTERDDVPWDDPLYHRLQMRLASFRRKH